MLKCLDGDVFEFYFGFTAGVNLHGDNTFGRNFGVLFDIIDGFDTVDVELVMLALAADDVGVPAVFFENVFEGAGVSFDQ